MTTHALQTLSLFALTTVAGAQRLQINSVETLVIISHSLEDTVMGSHLRGTFYAGFQYFSAFLPQARRFRRLAAECGEVLVFGVADIAPPTVPGITFVELEPMAPLAQEWFIVFESPAFQAALLTHQVGPTPASLPSKSIKHTFGRGRDYKGLLSLKPELAHQARLVLEAAVGRGVSTASEVEATTNRSETDAPELFFNQAMIGYLESRNQQIMGLYNTLTEHTQELERLQSLLRRLVSQTALTITTEAAANIEQFTPTIQTYTVLFSDVQGFTPLAETQAAERLVTQLNHYLDVLATTIYQQRGDVDKFLGDGMLAFFTNPRSAVQAALVLQKQLVSFNEHQLAAGQFVFQTRLGLATGPCSLARVGSRDRQEITLLGDVVNLASRLQELSPVGGLLMDQATYQAIGAPLLIRGETLTIRGKRDTQLAYALSAEDINLGLELLADGSYLAPAS